MGLANDETVRLEIFDAMGNAVALALDDAPLPAGLHRVSFDISRLSSGDYFCRMSTSGGEVLVEKLVVRE